MCRTVTALEYYFGFKTELVEASQLRILAWINLRNYGVRKTTPVKWKKDGKEGYSARSCILLFSLCCLRLIIIMSKLYLRYYYYVYIMSMLLLLHTAKQSKLVPRWLSFILVLILWQRIPVLLQIKINLVQFIYFTLNTPVSEDIFVTRQTKNSPVKEKNSKEIIN